MDPLSEILSLLKPRAYMFGGLDVGSPWAVRYEESAGIKCQAIASGSGWLTVDGIAQAVRLQAGDCVLLPSSRAFCLATDPAIEPGDFFESIGAPLEGAFRTINGGGSLSGVGGYFELVDGMMTTLLLDALPPIVHIRDQPQSNALRWCIEQIMSELREPRAGSALVSEHLIQLMLLQALRLHLTGDQRSGAGWLLALADESLSAALFAIHADPARNWTIAELAEQTRMSRSSFAARFKDVVGLSPIGYLTHWRMQLAQDRLANTNDSLTQIAPALGYESESAFSAAFKRVVRMAPREYRQQTRRS